ncbi:MAG: hypothetical protein GX096_02040 [Clostridiales bacterium]|nr:hypothetical protein [Clostridiales bacterium]
MKEINGTVTLAYVEEDNRQRVIFRVIPLCTREGTTFHGSAEEFPDEGSLRIVPDKREQSTFKERMREIGGLCTIQLISDGKELVKVRQNRNYSPEQGERNQYAIYSDVIFEFTEDGCYEVIEHDAGESEALTPMVLLHKDKMLYGPIKRDEAATANIQELKPYGNDRFLLHTIETSELGKHLIYWNPESTLNWRQRRSTLRRQKNNAEEVQQHQAAEVVEVKNETSAKPEIIQPIAASEKVDDAVVAEKTPIAQPAARERKLPHMRRVARAAEILKQQNAQEAPKVDAPKEEKEAEAVLPIGTHLEILDTDVSFEQHITRLAQPLSDGANRLTSELVEPEAEQQEAVARFSGTPLEVHPGQVVRTSVRPEPLHHVVEQQLRRQRQERDEVQSTLSAYGMIENPIEKLQACLDYVWQNADMREQAIDAVMKNERFVSDIVTVLKKDGLNLQASAAAEEQLMEIEAERLRLLMELETAKTNERKYREAAIASVVQKKRDELERTKRELKDAQAMKAKLNEASQVLSRNNAQQMNEYITKNISCVSGISQERIVLSPVLGQNYSQQELAEQLRVHMNESGFRLNEDEAMSLLINFSLYDAVCFRAKTMSDAQMFAVVLLESFGLQSVSATVYPDTFVEVYSLLPENTLRTPTVTIQPLGTEAVSVYGHKTLYMADTNDYPQNVTLPYPIIDVPQMQMNAFGRVGEWNQLNPASISTFAVIRSDSHPMLAEAEKWFDELKHELTLAELGLSDAVLASMRRFIEVATRKVRGGFLAAADTAVCHWIVPLVIIRHGDSEKLAKVLAGLPRSLDRLGMR